MRISFTLLGRSVTVEACGLSYLYVETDSREFTIDRHHSFQLPNGEFRHWLLEEKRPYPSVKMDDRLPNAA